MFIDGRSSVQSDVAVKQSENTAASEQQGETDELFHFYVSVRLYNLLFLGSLQIESEQT